MKIAIMSGKTVLTRNHRNINYNIFFSESNTYQYFEPINSTNKNLEKTAKIYCPLEVDTEFTNPLYEINKPCTKVNKTITVQYRAINEPVGKIFVHPDISSVSRHPIAKSGFTAVDYLTAIGYQCELVRIERPEKRPILQFDLYGFFLVSELYRIIQGQYRQDIDLLVRSNHSCHGKIEMGRRLIASTVFAGNKAEQWVLMPWVLTIDGFQFQVAISLFDTCAVHGVSSYLEFCTNSGVKLQYKDTFSSLEKSRMLEMYLERPDDFDNYALGDLYNYQALLGNMERFKTVYESLGIIEYFEPPRLTIGATVARIFRSILLNKLGLDISGKNQVIELCRYGTADQFKQSRNTTAVYLAKVDGGRCRNNRPTVACTQKLIADADIAGCYGNGLKNQEYPLGRPVTIDYLIKSKNNDYLTLRKFLKKYKSELVPGLWKARVSTKDKYLLKYPQDFLVSWHPPKNPANIPTDTDLEAVDWFTEENIGTTKIFTREINLAVITEEFIDWLEKTCSPHQRKELLDNLVIVTAVYYPRSEQCYSINEFFTTLKNHQGKNSTSVVHKRAKSKKVSIQQECHAWIAFNLGDLLVNQLLEERSKYNKKNPDEKPLNTLYKLCINTIYGDMVSPFFDVGNTIVGDNITARARAMAWYMEKGLNGFQTITDGCAFEINRCLFSNGKTRLTAQTVFEAYTKFDKADFRIRPIGYDKSIEYYIYQENNRNKVGLILGDTKFDNYQSLEWLAKEITTHLKSQFPNIPVIDKFNFEIKDIYTSASFHGTANYKFWIGEQELKGKMRSYRKEGVQAYSLTGDELQMIDDSYTPSDQFLTCLKDNPKSLERSKTYLYRKILKPGEYTRNYESRWKFGEAFPGCTIENARLLRECSLTQFTFQTYKQLRSWETEQARLLRTLGQSYEAWFQDDTGNLDFQSMIDTLDELIRTGKSKFSESRKANDNRHLAREYVEHPEQSCLIKAKHQLGVRYQFIEDSSLNFEYEPVVINVEVVNT